MSRLWKRCIVVLIRDYSFNVRCLFFSFVYFISYFKSTYLGTEDFWAGLSPRSWPQELVFRRGAWIDKEILDKELCVLVKCTAIRTSSCARPCMISPNDRFGSRDIFIAQQEEWQPDLLGAALKVHSASAKHWWSFFMCQTGTKQWDISHMVTAGRQGERLCRERKKRLFCIVGELAVSALRCITKSIFILTNTLK